MKAFEKLKKIKQQIQEKEIELKELQGNWCGTVQLDLNREIKRLKKQEKKIIQRFGLENMTDDIFDDSEEDDKRFQLAVEKVKKKRKK